MNKKIFSICLIFLILAGCSDPKIPEEEKQPEEAVIEREEYIAPVKDVFIFGELQEELKDRIKKANCNSDYENYQFKMLSKEVYEGILNDIDGNEIKLDQMEEFYLEVVSVDCSHCKKQLSVINSLAENVQRPFIQYFNVGEKEDILAMYEEQGVTVSDQLTLICHDDGFEEYLRYDLGLKMYPTIICFKDGKVSFSCVGEADEDSFGELTALGFDEVIDTSSLLDGNGEPLLEASRSTDDLWNDLSTENQEKILELDNDDYTKELTLKLMGNTVDFSDIQKSQGDRYFSQVDDFEKYENEKLILLYTYLRDNSETEKVKFINELIDQDDGNRYIVVLVEGLESSSFALNNMDVSFHCPVVSVLGRMPLDFFNFGLVSYPTAVFIDKGTFTGGYSNIEDKEKFALSKLLFLGDECIAYKKNN